MNAEAEAGVDGEAAVDGEDAVDAERGAGVDAERGAGVDARLASVDAERHAERWAGVDARLAALLARLEPEMRSLVLALRALVVASVPDAIEEIDDRATMVAFTFLPGTYKGLFAAIIPHRSHANLMFSEGVALLPADRQGLLEGTGKQARHIAFRDVAEIMEPEVRELLIAAAARKRP